MRSVLQEVRRWSMHVRKPFPSMNSFPDVKESTIAPDQALQYLAAALPEISAHTPLMLRCASCHLGIAFGVLASRYISSKRKVE